MGRNPLPPSTTRDGRPRQIGQAGRRAAAKSHRGWWGQTQTGRRSVSARGQKGDRERSCACDKAVVACPWREGRHVWVGDVGDIAAVRAAGAVGPAGLSLPFSAAPGCAGPDWLLAATFSVSKCLGGGGGRAVAGLMLLGSVAAPAVACTFTVGSRIVQCLVGLQAAAVTTAASGA